MVNNNSCKFVCILLVATSICGFLILITAGYLYNYTTCYASSIINIQNTCRQTNKRFGTYNNGVCPYPDCYGSQVNNASNIGEFRCCFGVSYISRSTGKVNSWQDTTSILCGWYIDITTTVSWNSSSTVDPIISFYSINSTTDYNIRNGEFECWTRHNNYFDSEPIAVTTYRQLIIAIIVLVSLSVIFCIYGKNRKSSENDNIVNMV